MPSLRATNRSALWLSLIFLGLSWAILVAHLQLVWSSNPQYRYGWAVPVLCLALFVRKPVVTGTRHQSTGLRPAWIICGLAVLALLYAPTRLIEAANPDWRVVSWALALEVVGLTLLLVYFVLGPEWLRRLAFPIAFFLVAVPWPTFLENDVIQGLTRADTGTAVELLDWLGVSALQHGNVIEVATGNVGVDDACSGIRSLQATLMISLFLGESYQLNLLRRLGLLVGGFALSFLFNLTRMCLLTWVAAHDGVGAIAVWHDQTGNTVLLACCLALWGLGVLLARKKEMVAQMAGRSGDEPAHIDIDHPVSPHPGPLPEERGNISQSQPLPCANPVRRDVGEIERERRGVTSFFILHSSFLIPLSLLTWFAVVEISVESWYRWHEARLGPVKSWTMAWPTNNPTFKTLALSDQAAEMLRYDAGQDVAWQADACEWQAIFLEWNPLRRALVYAQLHTPDVCITAGGHPTTRVSDWVWSGPGGLRLPFAVYTVADTPQPMHVFYCMWSDRSMARESRRMPRTIGARLEPVLAGVRNAGHRSLEIAVTGNLDESGAESAMQQELERMIRTQ